MNNKDEFQERIKRTEKTAFIALFFTSIATILLLFNVYDPTFSVLGNSNKEIIYADMIEDEDKIENGIHVRTGLVDADGLMTVVNNCTNCHSAKLVIQNRMSAQNWNTTIKWMQETQNLWHLGGNQEIIVNYLVANYPVQAKGRREVLKNINWYILK